MTRGKPASAVEPTVTTEHLAADLMDTGLATVAAGDAPFL